MRDSSDSVPPPYAVPPLGPLSSALGPSSSDCNLRATKLGFSTCAMSDNEARSEASRSSVRMRCVKNEKGLVSPISETIGCRESTSPT